MNGHISSFVKTCFFQFCKFHLIQSFIFRSAAITLANAFIHLALIIVIVFPMVCQSTILIAYKKYSIAHIDTHTSCSSYNAQILKSLH